MIALPTQTKTDGRIRAMLTSALGEAVINHLSQPDVIELMLNPDGKLWVDKLTTGRQYTGFTFNASDAERVIFIVARIVDAICNKDTPIVSAELPIDGARFQGLLPPLVENPTFSIRKKALRIFTIDDYVRQKIITSAQAEYLKKAVVEKKNILIAGGTGSGKTTLANAVLAEIAKTNDRIVILEDTQELQCLAIDSVALRTKENLATMTDLLKATMRLRPDRIVVGEVRGKEALDLLKAWFTGHPGGCATLHANSATRALLRLEQLIQEAGVTPSKDLIGEAVNVIAYIEKTPNGRRLKELATVAVEGGKYEVKEAC